MLRNRKMEGIAASKLQRIVMIEPSSGLHEMIGSWLNEAESLAAELLKFVSKIHGEDRAEISASLIPADHSGQFQENPMANPDGLFVLF